MTKLYLGLRGRLLGLVLLAVIPAFALALYTGLHERSRAREDSQTDALRIAERAGRDQEDRVSGVQQTLAALANLPAVAGGNYDECNAFFSALLADLAGDEADEVAQGSFGSISVADSEGTVVCSSSPTSVGRSIVNAPWYSRMTRSAAYTTGGYTFSQATGNAVFISALPITRPGGGISSVMVLSSGFDWLEDLFNFYELPAGATITIVDSSGKIMAHYPDNAAWVGKDPDEGITEIVAAEKASGTVERRSVNGVESLFGFTPLPYSEPGREAYLFVGIPSSVAYAATNNVLRYTLIGLGAVAVLVGATAWFGRDLFVLHHLKTLAATAEQLEQGDLSARSGVPHTRDEIGQLATTLDRMAASLEEARSQRDTFEASLERANQHLAQKVADLDAFTYSISHDLKEPLRAIEGFSQFVVTGYSDALDPRGQDLLGRISKASVRMKYLIDDLLALSRAGKEPGATRSVANANDILSEIIETLAPLIQERNASIVIHKLPSVAADRARVDQIFRNLITNGLKFNESSKPSVEIGISKATSELVTFYVKDNGIGIEPQYHEKIFGLFQRLHTRDEFEGNGAGLAIVKRSVEAMSGKIWLESQKGQGTTFFVSLPLPNSPSANIEEKIAA